MLKIIKNLIKIIVFIVLLALLLRFFGIDIRSLIQKR